MKKKLHLNLLLGAALLGGIGFSACNSDKEPDWEEPVVTELKYSLIMAPQLFESPIDIRDVDQKKINEINTAQNKGAVVLRTLKEVENYFGSKLEENSPLRTLDYTKSSVVTTTLFLTAPIVKTTLGWRQETRKKGDNVTEYYVYSVLMQYESGTQDDNRNIFYNVQPTIVVDAIPAGALVLIDPNANTLTNP